MTKPHDPLSFATRLILQDEHLSEVDYQKYRMKLEQALIRAQQREKLAGWIVGAACILSFGLMFVGGSNLARPFDPWSKESTPLSVTLGVIYVISTGIFLVGIASYYSRFRPRVKEAREQLRDASILDLQRQVRELRRVIDEKAAPSETTKRE